MLQSVAIIVTRIKRPKATIISSSGSCCLNSGIFTSCSNLIWLSVLTWKDKVMICSFLNRVQRWLVTSWNAPSTFQARIRRHDDKGHRGLWCSGNIEYISLRRTGCSDLGVLWLSDAQSSHGDVFLFQPHSTDRSQSCPDVVIFPLSWLLLIAKQACWRWWREDHMPRCSQPHEDENLIPVISAGEKAKISRSQGQIRRSYGFRCHYILYLVVVVNFLG